MPLLSAPELEHAFRKERSRVDRTGRGCALVTFQIDRTTASASDQVASLLRSRSRLSDTLGRLDPHLLVALLPETSGQDAWSFSDDIKDAAHQRGLELRCEVHCYPQDWTPVERDSGTFKPREKRTARPGSYAEFEEAIAGPSTPDMNGNTSGTMETSPARRRAEEETTVLLAGDAVPAEAIGTSRPPRPIGDVRQLIAHRVPMWKRSIDIAVSGVMLVLLSPLFFVVGLAVKTTSRGPMIFKQRRMGEGGKSFTFYKFRSMYQDAEQRKAELLARNEADGPVFKIRNDPRLTAIGKILRSTSVDELPQLWNVFKGDMTLVGPRPPTLDEVPNYELWQLHRLATRGGITCIWQVSGRSDIKFLEWARMDLRYLATKSFWTDLTLLWQTMAAVISRKGAY